MIQGLLWQSETDAAILIDRQVLGVDEFILEILQTVAHGRSPRKSRVSYAATLSASA
jgi:hypothetical protein